MAHQATSSNMQQRSDAPEKRKAGGSTPPLTASSDQRKRALSNHSCAICNNISLILVSFTSHCGASAASRLLVAAATPPTAVATPAAVLALKWAVMSETAVSSLAFADFTALVWA